MENSFLCFQVMTAMSKTLAFLLIVGMAFIIGVESVRDDVEMASQRSTDAEAPVLNDREQNPLLRGSVRIYFVSSMTPQLFFKHSKLDVFTVKTAF